MSHHPPPGNDAFRIRLLEMNAEDLEKVSRLLIAVAYRCDRLISLQPGDGHSYAQKEMAELANVQLSVVRTQTDRCLAFARGMTDLASADGLAPPENEPAPRRRRRQR